MPELTVFTLSRYEVPGRSPSDLDVLDKREEDLARDKWKYIPFGPIKARHPSMLEPIAPGRPGSNDKEKRHAEPEPTAAKQGKGKGFIVPERVSVR